MKPEIMAQEALIKRKSLALNVAMFPFLSLHVLCGFTALWSFKVLPVFLALTALNSTEELLDESFGFCFNCGQEYRC